MQSSINRYSGKLILFAILVCAIVLRFHKLGLESLWLDELHTMNECDPSLPWSELFRYLMCCDQHPPLFFISERLMFTLFGHTGLVARILPALAGVGCVWGMYKLGKEILNERLGLIAAALLCFNYYNIFYSQEARDYIFLWLFTTLSFAFFFRFAKSLTRKDAIWYILTTVLMLYSHYFSLLVIFCQLIIFFVLLVAEKNNRAKFFKAFFITELIVLATYVPWFKYLQAMANIQSFWIQYPQQDFYATYLSEYIGHSHYLLPFIYIFLIMYMVHVFLQRGSITDVKNNPVLLSFVFIFISIIVSYLIMYVRSVMVVPMMISRYTVIVLPGLILAIAYGVNLIGNRFIQYMVLALFLFLCVFDIIYVKKYYRNAEKEQFREVTQFITEENKRATLFNQVGLWQQGYYLKMFGYEGPTQSGNKEAFADSLLHSTSPEYGIDSFWFVGVHGDGYIEEKKRRELDEEFLMINHKAFIGTWAELWVRKPQQVDTLNK